MVHLGILKRHQVEEMVCEVFTVENKMKHELNNLSSPVQKTGVATGVAETEGKTLHVNLTR